MVKVHQFIGLFSWISVGTAYRPFNPGMQFTGGYWTTTITTSRTTKSSSRTKAEKCASVYSLENSFEDTHGDYTQSQVATKMRIRSNQWLSKALGVVHPMSKRKLQNHRRQKRQIRKTESISLEPYRKRRVIVIVDETGSMGHVRQDVINNFNSFLISQKSLDRPDVKLSIVKFDTKHSEIKHNSIQTARSLTSTDYAPSGMTALFDAVGCTLDRYSKEYDNIVMIITDGDDNSSWIYGQPDVRDLICRLGSQQGWTFGAVTFGKKSQKLSMLAKNMCISQNKIKSFSANRAGVQKGYNQLSKMVASARDFNGGKPRFNALPRMKPFDGRFV